MRPQARPIEFQSYGTKEVVNYSAIANKAKQLSDNVRTVAFDQVNDSITFKSSLIHDKPPVSIKPSDNSINNVSSINCTDGSTITGITSDSSNTDPTKAISSLIINDLNERIESLESKDIAHEERMGEIEAMDTAQNETISNINTKNDEQDTRLDVLENRITSEVYSSSRPLKTIFSEMPDCSIKMIKNYPGDLWTSIMFRLDESRTFTISLPKYSYTKVNEPTIRIYFNNGIDSNKTAYHDQAFRTLLTDYNYNKYAAAKSHKHALSEITDLNTSLDSLESKNTEQDTRLDTIEAKDTEQDTRLDTLENTTIPTITQDISNLQQADTVLHQESVNYYDYSREHIEEIENTTIPAINTKNTEQDERISSLESVVSNLLNNIYPVGSIYLSLTKSPPSLGGTWELIDEGKFLYSTTSTSGETGGSLQHTHATSGHVLTAGEMPKHKHDFNGNKITGTVYDIMKYDSGGQTNKNPEGAFSVNRYGNRTWDGIDGSNRAFSLTFTATPTGSITFEGNNKAHNHGNTKAEYHIPPYITCFMYKRTA